MLLDNKNQNFFPLSAPQAMFPVSIKILEFSSKKRGAEFPYFYDRIWRRRCQILP